MTLEDLKNKTYDLLQAIKQYRSEKDYNETDLERLIDELLCKLPQDLIYVEWFDRSDIRNMADGVYDDPVDEDMVDRCMEDLDRFNGSFIENESIQLCVNETVRYWHENKGE